MNFNWFEKAKIMIFGQNQQNSIYFEISLQGIFSEIRGNNELIIAANTNGGPDNVTALLAKTVYKD